MREQIICGQRGFEEAAAIESDCPTSVNGGRLQGRMESFQKPFTDAYRRLRRGEISDIVETDSGVHIILRLN